MCKFGPFIIKASILGYVRHDPKPLWKWSGFHHYLVTLAIMSLAFFFYGGAAQAAGGAWIATCIHYFFKELTENGKSFEILDFLTPLAFGGVTAILFVYIERLI